MFGPIFTHYNTLEVVTDELKQLYLHLIPSTSLAFCSLHLLPTIPQPEMFATIFHLHGLHILKGAQLFLRKRNTTVLTYLILKYITYSGLYSLKL
jgi:hypothetical protein